MYFQYFPTKNNFQICFLELTVVIYVLCEPYWMCSRRDSRPLLFTSSTSLYHFLFRVSLFLLCWSRDTHGCFLQYSWLYYISWCSTYKAHFSVLHYTASRGTHCSYLCWLISIGEIYASATNYLCSHTPWIVRNYYSTLTPT